MTPAESRAPGRGRALWSVRRVHIREKTCLTIGVPAKNRECITYSFRLFAHV